MSEIIDLDLIGFLADELRYANSCDNTSYWLLPMKNGLRYTYDDGYDNEHWKIYNLLDIYYSKNKDPIYSTIYDEQPENFSSLVFSDCFSDDPETFCFNSEEYSLPIRFLQEYGNSIRLRCMNKTNYDEMNVEFNLGQKITKEQKNQLKKLWCDIKEKDNKKIKSLYIDIVHPESTKFQWKSENYKETFSNFNEFIDRKELDDIKDMECNSAMEKLIQLFENVQKGYTIKKRFEDESKTDPYGRSPEELEKRFHESQSLLKFHGEGYY